MYGADASCQKGSNIHVQLSISRAFNVTANLYVMRPAAPKFCFFSTGNAPRWNPATFLGLTFLVFSQVKCVLYSQATVNSHVMRPTAQRLLARGIPRRHCRCKFSLAPKPGRRPNVDKGALY